MNRRGFFSLFAGATAAAIALPDLELLLPKRTFFLPPVGGWHRNQLLTAKLIAEEALRVLSQSTEFLGQIDREYDAAFHSGDQWTPAERSHIAVRQPPRYDFCITQNRIFVDGVSSGDKITFGGKSWPS